jgi:rhodanese-related sulfurtransferase/DNA-binding transcriptional ArsR family regulator
MTSKHRAFKNAINDQFARIAKALASPRRLELLDALAQCPRTVESLANQTGMSVANTSQHLQTLRAVGLVAAEKDGLFVSYSLAGTQVPDFLLALRRLATSLLGDVDRIVQQFAASRHPVEPVDRETLLTRIQQGEVVLVDVRPFEEYRAGHIPGARSMPMAELEQRLTELPRDRQIVAYCRGPYCLLAPEAVEILRARGFTALRLEDGVHEWRAHGLRIHAVDPPGIAI